jgi:hypothetical protein
MSSWFYNNRHLYPANWQEIRAQILQRDNHKCKWCGVPNGSIGYRDEAGCFHLWPEGMIGDILSDEYGYKVIKIILTIAHLGAPMPDGSPGDKKDKMDCRDENLAALCQKCHLAYDGDEHKYNSALTRRRRKIEAGQLEMGL